MRVGSLGIRSLFRIAIATVALLAFLVIAGISYRGIGESELAQAQDAIRSEVNYLCLQLAATDEHAVELERLAASTGDDPADLAERFPELFGDLSDPAVTLIDGYTLEETGTVVVMVEGTVVASDDPKIPIGGDVRELLGDDTYAAVGESCRTDDLQRIMNEGASAGSGKQTSDDAYLLARQQGEHTVLIIESADMIYRDRTTIMGRVCTIALIVLVAVLFIVDRMLNLLVARRIDRMNDALGRITAGDLSVRLEDRGTREFKSLSRDVNHTVDALQGLIADAEARMDEELATARAIQEAALPRIFPPYPDILKFDLYASMEAARQVGGDFYDFFLIGDDAGPESGKLGFVVADVSGKGVPAALFMMKAKTQVRDYLQSGMDVGEAMDEANRQLCDGNDENMFVTAWVGVLDYANGHIEYVNAGHNPPLLWQREGGWRWLRERSGPMLGLFEGRPYRAHVLECAPGDMLLLYTDGVTEAWDTSERLYGEDRLLAVVERGFSLHPRELVESVRADVAAHTEGAEQSDDITVLALEFGVPPEITAALEVPALIPELDRVNDFLHEELDRRLCPQRVQDQLDVAVEELYANVCSYAYPDATPENPGKVRVLRTYHADPASITVDIIDSGVPFDPLARSDAVTPKDIEDVPIGGLGILLTKKMVDEIRYERTDDMNVVTIVKRW